MDTVLSVMLGLIFVGVGAGLMKYSRRRRDRVLASRRWPYVTGEIVRSEVGLSDDRVEGTPFHTPGLYHDSKIEYTYQLRGRTYHGDTVAIGGEVEFSVFNDGELRARKRCNRYPVGRRVRVYINPRDPATSCLECRAEMAGLGYAVGIPFFLAGLVMALSAFA